MSFLSKVILFGTILNFLFYENPHTYIDGCDVKLPSTDVVLTL